MMMMKFLLLRYRINRVKLVVIFALRDPHNRRTNTQIALTQLYKLRQCKPVIRTSKERQEDMVSIHSNRM
jgi:hypothetical protein